MTEGVKHDTDKYPLHLLPFDALLSVACVLHHGQIKYGARNWEKGMDWSRVQAAALRHLFAWSNGEDIDPESGMSHLAHATCCLLFLLAYELRRAGHDDRPWAAETGAA
jgi:hypothetical protein